MINEARYHELCNACRKLLLKEDAGITRVAIPWLHVIREHPVVLRKYESLFSEASFLKQLLTRWKVIVVNKIIWVRQLVRAMLSDGQLWVSTDEPPGKTDYLFISHYLNTSQLNSKTDFYFSDIPNQLLSRGRSVAVGLIDHINRGVKSEQIMKNAIPRYFFSNTLRFSTELEIRKRLKAEAKRLKAIAAVESDILAKEIAIQASREATMFSTQSALRLAYQVERLIRQTQPDVIITTYEGHAFERIVFAVARTINSRIKCVSYQHASIFRLSNAIRQRLQERYNPDYIFTSGQEGKVQLEKEENLRGIPVGVLGSSRGVIHTGHDIKLLQRRLPYTCLVLPEGLESEVLILFRFSLRCALLQPTINFIWRLHPLISFTAMQKKNSFLQKLPTNVTLSSTSIENDIEASSWVLYRGTTAVYKAMSEGLRPIYLRLPDEMTIDPLYRIKQWRKVVESENDFKLCIEKDISDEFCETNNFLAFAREICENQFAAINIQILDDLITGRDISKTVSV